MKKKVTQILMVAFISALTINASVGNNEKVYYDPPMVIKNPASTQQYSPDNRKFTGISSLAISPKGRMWVVWYAGLTPGEDLNNYVVVATSGDKGETWEEVLAIDPDGSGPIRAYDPEVWIDPDGKLWIFWAQQTSQKDGVWATVRKGTSAGVWSMRIDNPESNEPVWSVPTRLTDGVMMCKPIVLTTGEWSLPVSMWKMEKESTRMVISTDKGKSWNIRGGASVPDELRAFDEHMIVERKDGSMWMLIRTRYGIGESLSNDRGYTWSPVIPSKIQHTSSRFFIYRLNSGNLLLVKHGPIDMRIGRSHLMAFVSEDDGRSWSDGLLLDERPGVSYPDGQQTSDGTIYITYDYNRTKEQQILVTSFTEDDVIFGTNRSLYNIFQQRKIISQGRNEKSTF